MPEVSRSSTLHAYLQLCRIPNVFTAVSNALAGVALARGGLPRPEDARVLLASALFYLAGMVFNDVFDRRVDAVERPGRPIPSGRVSAASAALLGSVFVSLAFVLVWPLGVAPRAVALGLAAAILLYDGGLKNTPLGIVNMGLCRTLNVTLGFAVAPWPASWMWVLPVGLGFYTSVITYLARDEVVGVARDRALATVRMMSALFLLLVVFLTLLSPADEMASFALAGPFLALLGIRGARLFGPLMRDASGPVIGKAIGGGILLMPAIDAAVLAAAGYLLAAVACLALTLPAMWLKRSFYMT